MFLRNSKLPFIVKGCQLSISHAVSKTYWHSKYILQPLTKRDPIHIKCYFSQQIFGRS